MSTTQELLAAHQRFDALRMRIKLYADALAATDYRGPRPSEHYIADDLLNILESV